METVPLCEGIHSLSNQDQNLESQKYYTSQVKYELNRDLKQRYKHWYISLLSSANYHIQGVMEKLLVFNSLSEL